MDKRRSYYSYVIESIRSDVSDLTDVTNLIYKVQKHNSNICQNTFFLYRDNNNSDNNDSNHVQNQPTVIEEVEDILDGEENEEDEEDEENNLHVEKENTKLKNSKIHTNIIQSLFFADVVNVIDSVIFTNARKEMSIFQCFCAIKNPEYVLFNQDEKEQFETQWKYTCYDDLDHFFVSRKYKMYGYDLLHMKALLSQFPQRIDNSILHYSRKTFINSLLLTLNFTLIQHGNYTLFGD